MDDITEEFLDPSDEEVLAVDEDVWSSSAEGDSGDAEEEATVQTHRPASNSVKKALQDADEEDVGIDRPDRGEEGWGSSKVDYYDADVIETEADALEEEAEAKRLQQMRLQGMTEADFGFDETQWLEADREEEADGAKDGVLREVLPKIEITDALGPQERITIMQTRYPEFEPLAKEFLDLQSNYDELTDTAKKMAGVLGHPRRDFSSDASEETQRPDSLVSLKHRALGAYLGALSMYFALLTSGNEAPNGKKSILTPELLREHAIMDTLVQCRDLWERMKEIPLPDLVSEEQDKGVMDDHLRNAIKESETSFLTSDAPSSNRQDPSSVGQLSKYQKKRIRKAERLALVAQEEALATQNERLRQVELSIKDLPDFTNNPATATAASLRKSTQANGDDDNSDFGDATSLTAYEIAEKAKRKKSLKFYTSQIAQKSNKRDGAGRDAGGDTDLPYRERLRDRQERLKVEAERRGEKAKLSTVGAPLGHGSSDEEADQTNAQRRQKGDALDSDDEYYNQVVKRASDRKASKAANAKAYDAAVNNSLTAKLDDNHGLDASGKRAITYAIEKNKGLHPHRKKDVRNPRVKKRKKYEDKQKKLKSLRAVYRPEREGQGGYGGEKTGIKRNLVRSVKL